MPKLTNRSLNTVKLTDPDGNDVAATPLQIVETTERYSEIRLEGGVVLRVKHVPVEAFRVDDELDESGAPTYAIKGTTVVVKAQD